MSIWSPTSGAHGPSSGAIWLQKSIPQSLLPPSPQPSLVSPHGELIAESKHALRLCHSWLAVKILFFNVREFPAAETNFHLLNQMPGTGEKGIFGVDVGTLKQSLPVWVFGPMSAPASTL